MLLVACGSDEVSVRMRQRTSHDVEAPRVTIEVGDIDGFAIHEDDVQIDHRGGVPLRVVGADGTEVLPRVEASVDEPLTFEADGKSWELRVKSVEPHTISDDFATIAIRPAPGQ
jgi:hypothetical protein